MFEVVSGGGEDGVDAVALSALEVVSVHSVLLFEVAYDGLDGGSPPEFSLDLSVDAAPLAGAKDAQGFWRIMADITLVDISALRFGADPFRQLFNDGFERVTVIWIVVKRLGVEHKHATWRSCISRCDRDLSPELIRFMGFSFTDAFGLRRVRGIKLGAFLAPLLKPETHGHGEFVGEGRFAFFVSFGLAANIANDPAQPHG